GPPCACGQRGCWERYASGSALGRFGGVAAEAGRAPVLLAAAGGDPTSVRGEHVVSAARNGDEAALAVVEEFSGWVAVGLANLVNIFDPALIVLGGGLAEAGDVLLAPVQERMMGLVEASSHRPPVEIRLALLGERAGAVGAAFWALENFFC
ncbi:MAG TPA: ROK family protein, partial [Acidimicrobiales bacterium]|nr:ROK family protein [Acidimicrobiales bacterium]